MAIMKYTIVPGERGLRRKPVSNKTEQNKTLKLGVLVHKSIPVILALEKLRQGEYHKFEPDKAIQPKTRPARPAE